MDQNSAWTEVKVQWLEICRKQNKLIYKPVKLLWRIIVFFWFKKEMRKRNKPATWKDEDLE